MTPSRLHETVGETMDSLALLDVNELRAVREKIDRMLDASGTDDNGYRLRQHLRRAMTALRDAEDYARIKMPAWPTAARIRAIYEQITADVLNGRTSVPAYSETLSQRAPFPVHDEELAQ